MVVDGDFLRVHEDASVIAETAHRDIQLYHLDRQFASLWLEQLIPYAADVAYASGQLRD